MKIKYFKDTDTALIEFADHPVVETKEISEDVYVDLDEQGRLISMTVEHAQEVSSLPKVDVQEYDQGVA